MKKKLHISFTVFFCFCAIFPYLSRWFNWPYSNVQDLTWLGFAFAFIGMMWTGDNSRKLKWFSTVLMIFTI